MSVGITKSQLSDKPGGGPPSFAPFSVLGYNSTSVLTDQQGINTLQLNYLDIPYDISFNQIQIAIASADNGVTLSDIGIYSESGALICNIGKQTGIGTGIGALPAAQNFFLQQGTVGLKAGRYVFAMVCNSNAGAPGIEFTEPTGLVNAYTTVTPGVGGGLPQNIVVVKATAIWSPGSFNYGTPYIRLHL